MPAEPGGSERPGAGDPERRAARTSRRWVSSRGPWEARFGYSRAIVAGDACWVADTTDAGPDGRSRHPGDPGAQARAIFEIVREALIQAGFALDDVVRTRMYVTDPAAIAAVGAVHGDVFANVRPAATAVVVNGLIDPSLIVEIEVDAVRGR